MTQIVVSVKTAGDGRQLRIEYEEAIDHLMSQGDRREEIFRDDVEWKEFPDHLRRCLPKRPDGRFTPTV
jgi:hypothetical protein